MAGKVVDVSTLEVQAVITELTGSKRVTCKQAARLLATGKVRKAYFRPVYVIDKGPWSDVDPAYVWYEEENPKEKGK